MDRQAIYDKVKHHLLVAQPRPALSGEGGYNYQDGHPGLTSEFRVRGLLSSYPDLGDTTFLAVLQAIHDNYPASKWESELAYIAKVYGLNP